jgi:hypothetical protein
MNPLDLLERAVPCSPAASPSIWWWAAWVCVVAVIAFVPAELAKILWVKRWRSWAELGGPGKGRLGKVALLAWILVPVGTVAGVVIFPRAELVADLVLAGALGGVVGFASGPLVHDFVFELPSVARRALEKAWGAGRSTVGRMTGSFETVGDGLADTLDSIPPVEDEEDDGGML